MIEPMVLLHNVRSATNVGAIFRTCEGAGVKKIYLSGYTPTPVTRFGVAQKDIAKSALGAERMIPWEQVRVPTNLLRTLKQSGCTVVCVEQDARAIDYKTVKVRGLVVFVFGNEVRGISKQILNLANVIAEIPMSGRKESLNVATAAGIALFRILNV